MYRPIGGIFITGIFGNFDTNRGGRKIFDFLNGNSRWPWRKACPQTQILDPPQPVFCQFSMQLQLPKFSSCLYSGTPSTKDRKDRDVLHKSLLFVKTASSVHLTSVMESRKQVNNSSTTRQPITVHDCRREKSADFCRPILSADNIGRFLSFV